VDDDSLQEDYTDCGKCHQFLDQVVQRICSAKVFPKLQSITIETDELWLIRDFQDQLHRPNDPLAELNASLQTQQDRNELEHARPVEPDDIFDREAWENYAANLADFLEYQQTFCRSRELDRDIQEVWNELNVPGETFSYPRPGHFRLIQSQAGQPSVTLAHLSMTEA
jgi:hypothetical protein